jgi:hypothetical protein
MGEQLYWAAQLHHIFCFSHLCSTFSVMWLLCEWVLRSFFTDDHTVTNHLHLGAASLSTNTEGTAKLPPRAEQGAGERGCVLFVYCGCVASCSVAKLSYAGTALFFAEVT